MKRIKWLSLTALVTVLAMLLTACGPTFDATKYAQASMDAMLHGDFTEYMKLSGKSEEEVQKEYDEVIESATAELSELGISEEAGKQFMDIFMDLFKLTKYEAKDVRKGDNESYEIDFEVQTVEGVFDGVEDELNVRMEGYIEELITSGEMPSEEEIVDWVIVQMGDIIKQNSANVTYGDPQIVTVSMEKNESGEYDISQDDIMELVEKMIDMDELTNLSDS